MARSQTRRLRKKGEVGREILWVYKGEKESELLTSEFSRNNSSKVSVDDLPNKYPNAEAAYVIVIFPLCGDSDRIPLRFVPFARWHDCPSFFSSARLVTPHAAIIIAVTAAAVVTSPKPPSSLDVPAGVRDQTETHPYIQMNGSPINKRHNRVTFLSIAIFPSASALLFSGARGCVAKNGNICCAHGTRMNLCLSLVPLLCHMYVYIYALECLIRASPSLLFLWDHTIEREERRQKTFGSTSILINSQVSFRRAYKER